MVFISDSEVLRFLTWSGVVQGAVGRRQDSKAITGHRAQVLWHLWAEHRTGTLSWTECLRYNLDTATFFYLLFTFIVVCSPFPNILE